MRFRGITKRLAPVLALVGLLATIVATSVAGASTTKVCSFGAGGIVNDKQCTPGQINPAVTQSNIGSTICNTQWLANHQPNTSTSLNLMQKVTGNYGVAGKSGYALDMLVPVQLGGKVSAANAWPLTTDAQTGWLAKQTLGSQLRDSVCHGKLPLAKAQEVMRSNWLHARVLLGARGEEASWAS